MSNLSKIKKYHWVDRLLQKSTSLGKLLSGIFGLFEVSLLEFLRRIDLRFNIYSMGILNKYLIRNRWGGRVLPLNINIDVDTKFLPTQEIEALLEKSNVTGIGWCYCRSVQRKYNEPNCDNPLYTCIHVGYGKSLREIPFKSERLKRVSKEEIRNLLRATEERGLVHQFIYFPSPEFYYVICNCCPCCCIVLKNFLKHGAPHIVKSDFIASTNLEKCTNCGTCEQWCYFGARRLVKMHLNFDPKKCFGCGVCVSKCPQEVIILEKKGEL